MVDSHEPEGNKEVSEKSDYIHHVDLKGHPNAAMLQICECRIIRLLLDTLDDHAILALA
jgi:hypothetical protein